MSETPVAPRLLLFDSGLGGLSVLGEIRRNLPHAQVSYLADDAGFPYGERDEATLVSRVNAIVGQAVDAFAPDAVVIACNTASTIALPELRSRFPMPFVGTVPAIKPAAARSYTRRVSVLATPGTVARDYTRALIREYGGDCRFNLVGSRHLAELAENSLAGRTVDNDTIHAEIAPCFVEDGGAHTDVIVLACTHYPLILDSLRALAPWPVTWLDPAPAIARQVARVLEQIGFSTASQGAAIQGTFSFTSGREAGDTLARTLASYGLASSRTSIAPPGGALSPAHRDAPMQHEGLKT